MSSTIDHHQPANPESVVWDWKTNPEIQIETKSQLRRRAILPITLTFLIGSLFRFFFEWIHSSWILYGICTVFVFMMLFAPTWLKTIENAMLVFGRWVGIALTWILLVPFFFIVFLPLRIFQTLSGGDPMRSQYDTSKESYWIDRSEEARPTDIEKQY